jgi:hypothetical protein
MIGVEINHVHVSVHQLADFMVEVKKIGFCYCIIKCYRSEIVRTVYIHGGSDFRHNKYIS